MMHQDGRHRHESRGSRRGSTRGCLIVAGTYVYFVVIVGFPIIVTLAFYALSSLEWSGTPQPLLGSVGYLGAVAGAEVVTSFLDPTAGMILHMGILLALVAWATLRTSEMTQAGLLLSFTLAPLTRIVSLALPLAAFPRFAWYLIASIPVATATWLVVRLQGYRVQEIGLTCPQLGWQAVIGLTGLPFGLLEYWILQPGPLVAEVGGVHWALLAVALIVATGLVEEFAFRGVMQRSAIDAYGPVGMVLVAAVFAALHIGWLSLVDVVFVFVIGLLFGYLRERTGSLLGVAVSHGLTNVTLFLIMPYLGGA
jgi:membrane protease YdiL (CAAX protease family)